MRPSGPLGAPSPASTQDPGAVAGSLASAGPAVTLAGEIWSEAGERGEAAAAARRKLGVGFWIAVAWVAIVVLAALLANFLPISDPNQIVGVPRQGPSIHHLLGTDDIGRDMLSRIIFGARVSLIVGFASVGIGLIIGGTLGLIAGFYGGARDGTLSAVANVLLAFPPLILALALISFVGQNLRNVVLVIAVLAIAPVQRIVRASTLSYAQREFVLSARALGAKNSRIIIREILPNVIPSALSFALVGVAVAIVAEGALAFLGLSVPPPTATWGGMISEGRNVLQQGDPMVSLWPSIAMFLLVLALNFVGDRLRSFFDVKEGVL